MVLRQTWKNGSQAGREAGDWSRGKGWVGLPVVLEIMSTEISSEAQSEFSTTTRASCHVNRARLRSTHTDSHSHSHTHTPTHTHTHTCKHTHTPTHQHTNTLSHSHTNTHTHNQTCTHKGSHSCIDSFFCYYRSHVIKGT